jgi:DNA-directed RNA polymerase subunit M/transcription elongation factor TFIIS
MVQKIKKIKKICECKHCGNEAEMMVTCTLTESETGSEPTASGPRKKDHSHRVKGSATCSHCGNEADMWVDLP